MNMVELCKTVAGLNICVDINSHIAESSACKRRIVKTTREGLFMARKLINAAIELQDLDLLNNTYASVNKLMPASDLIDSVDADKIKTMRGNFNKYVAKLLKRNPLFVFRYILPSMNNQNRFADICTVYKQTLMPYIISGKDIIK